MKIILTGGAGSIGSHTGVLLLEEGHKIVIIDDLFNSSVAAIDRMPVITKPWMNR